MRKTKHKEGMWYYDKHPITGFNMDKPNSHISSKKHQEKKRRERLNKKSLNN